MFPMKIDLGDILLKAISRREDWNKNVLRGKFLTFNCREDV